MSIKTALFAAALAATAIAGAASAETRWDANHPRQAEVLGRDVHQRREVRQEVREGELSRGQAAHLLRADHRIAREDHRFSRVNGGFITRGQQRLLNHQENRVHSRLP